MAARRRSTTVYNTYGSVAYAPAYDGSAVRAPRREEELQRRPQPKTREHIRRKQLTRTQGQVAPFAVVGFIAVAVFAALLITSFAQFTALNGEVVSLQNQLTTLQTENATLSAQYEKVFDMETIQAAVGESMVRPTSDQVEYIDLSEPDTVVVYGEQEASGGIVGALKAAGTVLGEMIEYFR